MSTAQNRREPRGKSISQRLVRRQTHPRTPQLVIIAGTQSVIDYFDRRGICPTTVKLEKEHYNNAYEVDMKTAKIVCKMCKRELCSCEDKHFAPVILGWKTRRKGQRVVLLKRVEMPIHIPARKAA